MIIDMHIHEQTYSFDSFMKLTDIVLRSKEIGLDGICITDHESNHLKEYAKEISLAMDFPIFVGAEILTYEGDALAFGVDRLPGRKMYVHELIQYVHNQGGVVISAHPYRRNNRGMEDTIKTTKNLDGIEGLNGSTPVDLNLKAYDAALLQNIPVFGGSDAHRLERVGKYATKFPRKIQAMEELVDAIKSGGTQPVYFDRGTYLEFPYHRLHDVV